VQEALRAKRAEVYEREAGVQAAEAEGRRLGGRLDAALAAADKVKAEASEVSESNTRLLKQVKSLVVLGSTLTAAVANKLREEGDTCAEEDLSEAPLVAAADALLKNIPDACSASQHLHSEVAALAAKLESEVAARKKEHKEASDALERMAFQDEELKLKLAASETHAASLAADLEAQQKKYHQESKALEDKCSEARAGRLKAEQELDLQMSAVTALKSDAAKVKMKLEDAEKSSMAAQHDAQELKKEKYNLQEALAKSQAQLDAALGKLDSAQVRVADLEKAVARELQKAAELQKDTQALEDDNKKKHDEIAAQKAVTLEKEKDAEEAREMVARLREAKDSANREAARETERVLHLQSLLKEADEGNEEKRKALAAAQAQKAALEKESAQRQMQLLAQVRAAHEKLDSAQVPPKSPASRDKSPTTEPYY
jgi:hypothetical protein